MSSEKQKNILSLKNNITKDDKFGDVVLLYSKTIFLNLFFKIN